MSTSSLSQMIIKQYYNDYITSMELTEEEFNELHSLFKVIYKDLKGTDGTDGTDRIEAPTRQQLMDTLSQLRGAPLRLLPITFENASTGSRTYLDMLHSRELQGDQRTAEWKQQRHNYITASVSAACAGLLGPAARENQLLEKASYGRYNPFKGGYYTDIGNIFEPVTNAHYSYIHNTRIHDFALIPSDKPDWHFLAASTDGIAVRGTELTNIEIKTLPGRVPDGKIKKIYAHQIQHQMECLGLEHTDFIEVKYETKPVLTPGKNEPIGVIMELWSLADNMYVYEYSPAGSTMEDLQQWMKLRESIIKEHQDLLFVRWIYWIQTVYSCIRVDRDPNWLRDVGPALRKFYEDVLALRADKARLNKMLRDREFQAHHKRTGGLFQDCLL